ncbi:hypothetical protein [Saprospira grandis]|uniref:hypothetical protein n=1 Tax=Saprospira grandis TaxID=1008 RepID=UPI0022DE5A4A|nr:hypothetical protein [Saprospira grandis]WBM75335.1 hypothetical protein OP864_03625 [Saprospira grandis]
MTNQEFIDKIIAEYKKARNLIHTDGGYRITRGLSHSISGSAEDLFALFIAQQLDDESLHFIVDKTTTIRFSRHKKSTSFRPDLMILKENVLTNYFDLKTDLGWKRDLSKYLEAKNTLIKNLIHKKNSDFWINWESKQTIKASKDLKYQIVVLSGKNISEKQLAANIEKAASLPYVEMYILTDGQHLNYYHDNEAKLIKIKKEEFDRLKEHTKSMVG